MNSSSARIRSLTIMVTMSVALTMSACSSDSNTPEGDAVTDEGDSSGPADVPSVDNGTDAAETDSTGSDVGNDNNDAGTDAVPFENGAVAFVSQSEDELIGGPMKAGVVGDVVIRNKFVRFVVRNQEHSLYSPYGGALVDADIVRPDGDNNHEKFMETFPMAGFARIFNPQSMEIVDDGTYSGTAVVRFKGTDGGMALVDSILPTFPLGLDVTVDYILGPDARFIEMRTTVKDPGGVGSVDLGQFIQFGNRAKWFFDRCGTDDECLTGKSNVRWLGSAAGDVSYALTVPGTDFVSLLIAQNELMILKTGTFSIPAGGQVVTSQYVAVGGGTIDDVVGVAREIRGEPAGEKVTVNIAARNQDMPPDRYFLMARKIIDQDSSEWVNASSPNPDGEAVIHLEPGTYDLVVTTPGAQDSISAGVEVTAGSQKSVDMNPVTGGWLHVTVKDGSGNPVTAAITLQPGADAAWKTGVATYDVVRDGERTFPVQAGEWTATISRGLVWSIQRSNVTVTNGQVTELTAVIDESIDTTGHIMLNTHEHCERSIDSAVLVQDRVYNALANGIEMMNPTDHDFFGSHQATITEMGLQDKIKSNLSCEVSPLWGHTTAGNCSNPPTYPMYFAVNYTLYNDQGGAERGLTATEIYNQVRNDFGCQFLAVNHPYRGGPTFETYGITATSDPAKAEPDLNLHLVDALEVYNKDDSLENIITENLPAWFNLLNRGYHIAAIGGSDEHNYRGNYGNPRNMVKSATDVPGDAINDDIFNNIKSFESTVIGGPVIRLTVDGLGSGQIVPAGTTVSVHVLVEAPDWMGVNFVKVVSNGEVILDRIPAALDGTKVRLDETFEFTPTSDAWVVAFAGSDLAEHEMTPVAGKQPISITNPVFIDADGNGYEAIYAAGAPWDE